MKKLIGLLTVLFLTINAFGQPNIGKLSYVERSRTKNNTVEDGMLNGVPCDTTTLVSFYLGKYFYLLAYEPNFPLGSSHPTERNVYLYRKDITDLDNRWIKASDVVVTGAYADSKFYYDFDFYKYDADYHNTSNSKVEFKGYDLWITLTVHQMIEGIAYIEPKLVVMKFDYRTANDCHYYMNEKNYYRKR